MKSYRLFTFMSAFLLIFILITSNAFAEYGSSRAGFFDGMWDGTVWIGHLIEKIYSDSYVYNDHNNGFFYNLGFFACSLILSWNIGLLFSIILVVVNMAILLFGLILVNKTKIINFSLVTVFLLITLSVLYNLNEKIEKWRNKSKEKTKVSSLERSPDQVIENFEKAERVKVSTIYYKNRDIFCDGEFIFERSSKTKIEIRRVESIFIGDTKNIWIEFNKKDGAKDSMTILVSEISQDSLSDLNKMIESIKYKV